MRRAILLTAAMLAAAVVGADLDAWAEDSRTTPQADTGRMIPKPATELPDFTGQWRIDWSRSDSLRGPGGPGGPARRSMGGRGFGYGRQGGGPGGRRAGDVIDGGRGRGRGGEGGRPIRLPSLMHVTHEETLVSFEDSTGTVLQEIVTTEGDSSAHTPGARVMKGHWNGDHLEVQHTGRGGAKVTESFLLEDGGKSLVIRVAMPAIDDRPAREFKRVYRRES